MELTTERSLQDKETWLWCLAFAVAVCWPLLFFTYPSGQDIPNHLARAFILLNPQDPALGAHFEVRWTVTPNLAWDVFAVTVGKFLSLSWTLKLFMILSHALTMTGVFLLSRSAAGRWTWTPLAATPFLFHMGVSTGFLSFNLGVGLALIACAWWAANTERNWARRLVVACLFSLLVFFAHFAAWGIYGVFVLGWELSKLVRRDDTSAPVAFRSWLLRLARDGTQGLLPFAVLAFAIRYTGGGASHVGQIAGFQWPHIRIVEASHIMDVGDWKVSLVFLGVTATYLLYLVARSSVEFSRPYAVAIVLLVTLFFAVPNEIRGTHYVVWRIALGAVLIAVASAVPTETVRARSSRFRLAVLLLITLGLSGSQAYSTYLTEAARRDYLTLIDHLPGGTSLFMAHSGIDWSEMDHQLGNYHMSAYAVIERKVMVQNMFANPAAQPIVYRRPALNNVGVFLETLDDNLRTHDLIASEHFSQFDWVVIHGPDRVPEQSYLPEEDYHLIREVGQFRLYCNDNPVPNPFLDEGRNVCPG